MNYPVWEIPAIGGSFLIATISILHVFVAHFAVGGGLFLVLTELKGYRENSNVILDYTRKHSKFFLLTTLVFGSVSGVGIWFIISIVSPHATSILIHSFVFGWATEWVFFVGEIVALFVYFYTFGRMEKKKHLLVGWIYFLFAWLSLFVINGILSFMLTPGEWINNYQFWSGFFNPSFFPSLLFRTFLALMLAGLFGFLTSTYLTNPNDRNRMVRYCAIWLLAPVVFFILSGYWYLNSLSSFSQSMILGESPRTFLFFEFFIYLTPPLIIGSLIMAIRLPAIIKRSFAILLCLLGLFYIGSFEWIRESARRPFIIFNYMYSNSIYVADVESFNKAGILQQAKWVKHRTATGDSIIEAGKEIFRLECLSCHTIHGPLNDIVPITTKYTVAGMDSMLNGLGKVNTYMPPFIGTSEERYALASYIVSQIHHRPFPDKEQDSDIIPLDTDIPSFNGSRDKYILLAWNDLGMHCLTDADAYFNIMPPANTLCAQLIRRGDPPEIIHNGVTITYEVEPGFESPQKHVNFWEYANSLFSIDVIPGIGLSGNGMRGTMVSNPETGVFLADKIPVVPYNDVFAFNPYPIFVITATDNASESILARTKTVAPVSTEMGCKTCHGGSWGFKEITGLSPSTAEDILSVHDRTNRTALLQQAQEGNPKSCQSCHGDPALNAEGVSARLNMSAAIHGFHANYLTDEDGFVCTKCHPASLIGYTKCLRGIHAYLGLDCAACHGYMEDHAISLLKHEDSLGKSSAKKLMKHLEPRIVTTHDEIVPRIPWENEPDCLNCHVDFAIPEEYSTFNAWTDTFDNLFRKRQDDAGIMCAACHGSPHAIYPADNPYGKYRDTIQPMQYHQKPYPIGSNKQCSLCHLHSMEVEMHHPNISAMIRNTLD
ncbi:cytochrome ubiquinol oxidase subunit I [bacterium]|nr:cytochrome ubiquinol oxidase subunit I [candidate division CSSED10-310 bacterium]